MRTTITLDDDIVQLVARHAKLRGVSLDTNLLIALLWPSHEHHELAVAVCGTQ